MGERAPRGRTKRAMTEAVKQGERIQQTIDAKEKNKPKKEDETSMQTGMRAYPDRFPAQHLRKPGLEADLKEPPMYEATGYKGSDKLKDMVAIITGGDSGIGRAVAVLYAREGADIAIVYLNEREDAEETKRAVEKEGRDCILISGDVSDGEFCEEAVAKTIDKFGKLDILVNNAAFQQHASDITDISDQHFDRTLKTLYGYFYMARAAVPKMKSGGYRHERVAHWAARQLPPPGLFDDQGRHPCLHPLIGEQSRGSRHPGERGCTWAGVDAAQSGR
jgi:hypothetical protein